jgi:hypothetical protein
MKTLTLQVEIPADGKLHFDLATGLPPGPAKVVVIVQPSHPSPAGSFPSLAGILAGHMPADLDVVEEVREIRRRATQQAGELPE